MSKAKEKKPPQTLLSEETKKELYGDDVADPKNTEEEGAPAPSSSEPPVETEDATNAQAEPKPPTEQKPIAPAVAYNPYESDSLERIIFGTPYKARSPKASEAKVLVSMWVQLLQSLSEVNQGSFAEIVSEAIGSEAASMDEMSQEDIQKLITAVGENMQLGSSLMAIIDTGGWPEICNHILSTYFEDENGKSIDYEALPLSVVVKGHKYFPVEEAHEAVSWWVVEVDLGSFLRGIQI